MISMCFGKKLKLSLESINYDLHNLYIPIDKLKYFSRVVPAKINIDNELVEACIQNQALKCITYLIDKKLLHEVKFTCFMDKNEHIAYTEILETVLKSGCNVVVDF